MDYVAILLALGVLGALGAIFGVILGFAGKKFAVEVDERVTKVRECLGGANCGACGYAGCDAFAQAVVNGEAEPNGCTPGGEKTATAIGKALGIEVKAQGARVALVLCQGTNGIAKNRYDYNGIISCRAAAAMAGGPKLCLYSCLGLGDCVKKCCLNAISIHDGIASVDPNICKGCGACAAECPRGVIAILPADTNVVVSCRNKDTGRKAIAVCMKACIGCKRCEKECKYEAIKVTDGFAHIDSDKCTRCGICATVCPRGCIVTK